MISVMLISKKRKFVRSLDKLLRSRVPVNRQYCVLRYLVTISCNLVTIDGQLLTTSRKLLKIVIIYRALHFLEVKE